MLTIDKIIGSKLDEILLVQYNNTKDLYWTESAVLQFDDINYIINVNVDTDEVEILFERQPHVFIQAQSKVDNITIIKLSELPDNPLNSLLGATLTWVWTMTNHQGYSDGIQFQFDTKSSKTIQFVAIASRLDIKFLTAIAPC